MSALPTPKLVDLDDPLAPRREPEAPSPTPQAPRRAAAKPPATQKAPRPAAPPTDSPSLADDPLVAVFARLPEGLSDRLADGLRALNAGRPRRARISQQEVLGALVDRYVTPDEVGELGELVDGYRRRIRR